MEGDCGGRHSRVGSTYGGIIEGWGTGSQIPADRSRSLFGLLLQTPYVIASPGFGEACGLATSGCCSHHTECSSCVFTFAKLIIT